MTPRVRKRALALALHYIRSRPTRSNSPLNLQGLTMSTPAFSTLSTETLATATGGVTTGSSNCSLKHELSPILHSLKDLNSSSTTSSSSSSDQSTLMFGMMAAMMSRR